MNKSVRMTEVKNESGKNVAKKRYTHRQTQMWTTRPTAARLAFAAMWRDWKIAHTQNKWNQREKTSILLWKLCTSHRVCGMREQEWEWNAESTFCTKIRANKHNTYHIHIRIEHTKFPIFSWAQREMYDEIDVHNWRG